MTTREWLRLCGWSYFERVQAFFGIFLFYIVAILVMLLYNMFTKITMSLSLVVVIGFNVSIASLVLISVVFIGVKTNRQFQMDRYLLNKQKLFHRAQVWQYFPMLLPQRSMRQLSAVEESKFEERDSKMQEIDQDANLLLSPMKPIQVKNRSSIDLVSVESERNVGVMNTRIHPSGNANPFDRKRQKVSSTSSKNLFLSMSPEELSDYRDRMEHWHEISRTLDDASEAILLTSKLRPVKLVKMPLNSNLIRALVGLSFSIFSILIKNYIDLLN